MLLGTSRTLAYKCLSCGSFAFLETSIFNLFRQKKIKPACRCGHTAVCISSFGNRICLKIPCFACGKYHTYLLKNSDVMHNTINILSCPETSLDICFLGNDQSVTEMADAMEKELESSADVYGNKRLFENSHIILESLNWIHDIAHKGRLKCSCNSSKVVIELKKSSINLKCRSCGNILEIKAGNNRDLRENLLKNYIKIGK